ncbi:hypothetical protein SBRCBS47491_002521 [Sporothrix bragantina]|uniref:GH16 domain-containing protein n=1 Tax=Sporothrix bragantina TaxID=671064 RepID=A0ABP0B7P0_9PEZI
MHASLTSVVSALLACYGSSMAAAAVAATPAQPLPVRDTVAVAAAAAATTTIIPSNSFGSQSAFAAAWDYNYPWGTDHNGGARMDKSQSVLDFQSNTLTITAKPVSGQKSTKQGGKTIAIHYLSGAVHAQKHITVDKGTTVELAGDFRATVTKGTWPAFWLTAVDGWPPEVDMAEWKGSGKISFNTFNTSSQVATKDVTYPSPGDFHAIRCVMRDENGKDVQVKFYMDGKLVTTQVGKGFTGKAMYLIINLQMEGSSGSPGPKTNTEYSARGVSVVSYKSQSGSSDGGRS